MVNSIRRCFKGVACVVGERRRRPLRKSQGGVHAVRAVQEHVCVREKVHARARMCACAWAVMALSVGAKPQGVRECKCTCGKGGLQE